VGSGAIACGLARAAAEHGDVIVWARSQESAERSQEKVPDEARVVTDLDELADRTLVIEAVIEDLDVKSRVLHRLGSLLVGDTVIGTTTSSLPVAELAVASGRPERFAGVHFFNPVEKMALTEVSFPAEASDETRRRVLSFCEHLGKTAVQVPDVAGFVVNRLLFPYLFHAVRLLEETGLEPGAVDTCMKLGAGHPMGPLKLLDFIGLDVAVAIGESLGEGIPARVRELVAAGRLGRKSGAGFYDYAREGAVAGS
jgi:3-hydroxyacyl-CoA dehydrogenase